MPSVKPILIFSCGNPSRGDDALGSLLCERLEAELESDDLSRQVEILTDFQLQIEHATDLLGRKKVLFVDASVAENAELKLMSIQPHRDTSYTTHAMTPTAVMDVYTQIYDSPLPDCNQLAIRGYAFELGSGLSDRAKHNLEKAIPLVMDWIDVTG